MFGQGKSVLLMKSASGGQEPFVKVDKIPGATQMPASNEGNSRIRKGARSMHTSTLLMSDNYDWKNDRTTHDKEFSCFLSKGNDQRQPAFSYPDTLETLGIDQYHRFEPAYAEHYCKDKPLQTAAALRNNRLAIGAKQLDSVGVKEAMRQQPPAYSTQYGRTHAYLGLLKSVEPQPVEDKPVQYAYQRTPVNDPITGDLLRQDIVPSRGFKKASAGKMIESENNKFKNVRSILSDGIL